MCNNVGHFLKSLESFINNVRQSSSYENQRYRYTDHVVVVLIVDVPTTNDPRHALDLAVVGTNGGTGGMGWDGGTGQNGGSSSCSRSSSTCNPNREEEVL